ncbi:hypothetical protein, partial [Pseudogracilibacillus sp. SO10305]|uniref:hypothetical protein n=1 Tax=Pseudogracilibacillus sp. SO10305 TaxID=3098292 RepID=UPI00300E08F9
MISLIKRLIVTSTITLLLIGSPQFIFASQETYNEKINEQHIEFKEEIEELEQPDKQGVQEYIDSELNEEENKLIEQKPDEDNMISIKSTKSAPKFTVGDSGPHVKELKNNLTALGYGNFPV